MNPARFVDVVSSNAAKRYGLFPRKGAICVGSDADIVIIDTSKSTKASVDSDFFYENADYTVYEGMEFRGKVDIVLRGGETVVKDGYLVAEKVGEFLKMEC
ncbi:dihydropyrimidinase [Aduncisulcus paluster]|uniref:dihydropyrimidinase n=1 Tax=Aduncisulcus paluster TaxID=2918883 RepID=A0ABQ5K8A0_9EUKA|nr:dihydropyrimidinase [Aduncisulcus paluster]